jgi:prepilin-type N-terminal cleavage/methylation domain-containing protein
MRVRPISSSSGFTMLELIVVIIIVGILATAINVAIFSPSLQGLKDQIVNHFGVTASVGNQDDKVYYYMPAEAGDSVAQMRSKYYFKQFWQFKIMENGDGEISYCIFSDQPTASSATNFDKRAHNEYGEVLTNGKGKYLCHDTNNPSLEAEEDTFVNLTKKYDIVKAYLIYNGTTKTLSSSTPFRFLFDSNGNVFLDEGSAGDGGDIKIFDPTKRPLLTSPATLIFCQNSSCDKNATFTIYPGGLITAK